MKEIKDISGYSAEELWIISQIEDLLEGIESEDRVLDILNVVKYRLRIYED